MKKWLIFLCFLLQLTFVWSQDENQEGLDKIFRTSDEDGETATQAARRKSRIGQSLPEGSSRVGCICMNGEIRPTISVGSCSGRGGVRFWLVENTEGDTTQYPTVRHAMNSENPPEPYIGPNPSSKYQQQPTIIVMPAPQVATPVPPSGIRDTQVIMYQTPAPLPPSAYLTAVADSTQNKPSGVSLMSFNPLIGYALIFCGFVVVCMVFLYLMRLLLRESPQFMYERKAFKRIRITLIKILLKDNRFLK